MPRLKEAPVPTAESHRTTVLVVDDEIAFQETVVPYLAGYRRITAKTGWQALEKLSTYHVDVVLLDLNLPDTTGLKLLSEILAERDDVEVIVITSHAELKNAVVAVKSGAFDFFAKSYENYQQLGAHIERALEHRRQRRAAILMRADEALREGMVQIENSQSEEMAEIARTVRRVATTPVTVLIEGESGVGKELLARYVHLNSDRASAPFVPVNLAAIPPTLIEASLFGHEKGAFTSADRQRLGKFELADGGTLFLDEVGELEASAQVKLLRALQEREIERIGGAEPSPIDVRVIAATNRDLQSDIDAGRFREDLFFRLNVVRLKVPPLRQRKADIPDLVRLLTKRAAQSMKREPLTYSVDALRVLKSYPWPGNVRELDNLVLRLVALHPGPTIRASDIPIEYCVDQLATMAGWHAHRKRKTEDVPSLYALAKEHFECFFVKCVVRRSGGNMAEAARKLGVSYATVKNKMYSPLGNTGALDEGDDEG